MSARIDLNHKIHVLTKKEELDSVRIPGKVIVVLDRQDPRLRWNMTAAVAIESQEHRPTPQN